MNSSPKVENAPKNVNGKNDASSRSKFNEFKSSNTNNYRKFLFFFLFWYSYNFDILCSVKECN